MKGQLAIISLLAGASQLAAFVKLWFTARIFGVGPELDAYNLALVFPTLIAGVLSGVLQTGLFPVRAKLNATAEVEVVNAFERSVFLGVLVLGGVITLLLLSGTSFIVKLLGAGAAKSVRTSLEFVFPFALLLLPLNLVGDCCGYLLAMRNRFAIAVGAPVINGIFGALLMASWPEGRLLNLMAGTILGLGLQVSICLWGLKSNGFVFLGPLSLWGEMRKRWQEMLTLGGWILPGVVFSNLIVSLPSLWVAKYGEGAVSAFGYAYRLHSSALQLLVMASSTVILAHFSNLIANNDVGAIRRILSKTGLISVGIGVLGMVVVWKFGAAGLELVFGDRFNSDAAARVSMHWLWLTAGLPFAILGNVFAKLWQAQRRPQLMSSVAGISVLTLTIVHFALKDVLREFSLSAALTVSAFSVVAVGWWCLNLGKRDWAD